MLSEACAAVPGAPRYQRVAASPSAAQIERLRAIARRRATAVRDRGRQRLDAEAATQDFARFVEQWQLPVGLRVPLSGHARQRASELCGRCRPRHQSGARRAHPRCRRAARDRPAPGRIDDGRLHAARHPEDEADARSTCIRARRNSGACMPPICRSSRACRKSRRCSRRSTPSAERSPGRARPTPRTPRISNGASRARCSAMCNSAKSCASCANASARRLDPHERRGQLRDVAASALFVSAFPLAARADERRDGLRRARGDRGEVAVSGTHGDRVRGRRLLHDVEPGTRDGDAVSTCR